MKIVNKRLKDLQPYEYNAKVHTEKQIKQIMESITDFGFNDPIGIDKDGIVIEGHGRLEAAKRLQMDKVPCIVLQDLSEEQKKAYILVHNQLTLNTGFDLHMLSDELKTIKSFDMPKYDFNMKQINKRLQKELSSWYGDERERTNNIYNLDGFDDSRTAGFYEMPVLEACNYVPDQLIGFNYVLSSEDHSAGVHFFIDDYQFERIWNTPEKYIDKLMAFSCVLTPDFSLYMDMPRAMKIWNVYRSRLIGQLMQDAGINVIPTLQWAEKETFAFCFDGIKPGGTVAVSTVGVMREPEARGIWKTGMDEAIKRIQPETVICYGSRIDYDFGNVSVKFFEARKGWK